MFKSQLVLVFAGREVQLVAHPQQKILRLFQVRDIRRADDAIERKRVQILDSELGARNPPRRLNVSKPPFSFFDFRLKQINGTAELFVARAILFELLAHEPFHPFCDQARLGLLFKVFVESIVTTEKTRIQEGRAHFHVACRQPHAFADAPSGMADLQRRVPQSIKQLFGHRFDKR